MLEAWVGVVEKNWAIFPYIPRFCPPGSDGYMMQIGVCGHLRLMGEDEHSRLLPEVQVNLPVLVHH